jgi:hypothetical protein
MPPNARNGCECRPKERVRLNCKLLIWLSYQRVACNVATCPEASMYFRMSEAVIRSTIKDSKGVT